MKCYRTTAAVLFLVLGVWSCNAYATSGYSWVGGYISNYDGPELQGIESLGAYAYLLEDGIESEENNSDAYWTSAEVGEGSSYGYAQVDLENGGEAEAYAEAWDGSYTKAIGRATAQLDFVFDAWDDLGSQITAGMDYEYELEASADNPGNWAHTDALFSVVLKNITTGEESSFEFDNYLDVAEGEDGYLWDYSNTSVSLFFNEGDQGMFRIEAYALAEASGLEPISTPAPGAMVLGSLGLGLVGWLRKRHAL